MKRFAVLIMVLMLVLCSVAAQAGTSQESGGYAAGHNTSLENIPKFKFFHKSVGLGIGKCPVYTAPTTSAYRCANGKASVDTRYDMYYLGKDANGWLMVRYETNKGACRVGYIPPKYAKNFVTKRKLNFSHITMTADTYLYVTDNPLDSNSFYAVLDPGETYYILARYDYYGDWYYIECTVDGQRARGFIAR